jgi:hypothetical protein
MPLTNISKARPLRIQALPGRQKEPAYFFIMHEDATVVRNMLRRISKRLALA